MKIALIGYGKMGKMVETLASTQAWEISAKFDENNPISVNQSVQEKLLGNTVLIDFSTPDAVIDNINACAKLGKSMVVGTTGWQDHVTKIEETVNKSNIGFVYASNFSIGVNLFYKIIREAAQTCKPFKDYDPIIEEAHHKFKLDAPSGTANIIHQIMQNHYEQEIPITSTRGGYIPGTHTVIFDSAEDTIQLTHNARNRDGFAKGALMAAKWIENRKGFHTFNDVIDSTDRLSF